MKNLYELKCERRSLLLKLEKANTEEEVRQIQQELADNDAKIREEEERQRQIELDNAELRSSLMGGFVPVSQTKVSQADAEKRANEFAQSNKMIIENGEARATIVSSGTIAPVKVGGINEPSNTVSSIVDMVAVEDLTGTSEYKEAYVDSWQSASKGTEGSAPAQSEPTFGSVTLKPVLIEVLSYISKQVKKQTPLQYEAKVRKGALIGLRRKVQKLITNSNVAGFYGVVNAINDKGNTMNTALKYGAIDEKTLRKIVLSYGGENGVEGGACLFLNKKDLIAFGDVCGANEKKAVYDIIPDATNPNKGIIKEGGLSVPYCIDPDLVSHSDTMTAKTVKTKTMAYGKPLAYKLGLWGNYEVTVSEDYKFAEGLLAIRGEVMVGGNVIQKDGFVVVQTPDTIA